MLAGLMPILDLICSCSWPPPYHSLSLVMSYDLLHHGPSSERILLYDLYFVRLFIIHAMLDSR